MADAIGLGAPSSTSVLEDVLPQHSLLPAECFCCHKIRVWDIITLIVIIILIEVKGIRFNKSEGMV